MKKTPKITLKIGAAAYRMTIVEDGRSTSFDLSKMDRARKRQLRRMTVGALTEIGYFDQVAA